MNTLVQITYGVRKHPEQDGWLPVVTERIDEGKPHVSAPWGRPLDEDHALFLAKDTAEHRASRYLGDYTVVVSEVPRKNPRARKNPLNQLEADLDPQELQDFEGMILKSYNIRDFTHTTATEARLALRFREAVEQIEGKYGRDAVKAVPAQHVLWDESAPDREEGRLMLIFEDVSGTADRVQFSSNWRAVEEGVGASMESYNSWSASIRDEDAWT